jgi:hypothetical protein
MVKPYASHALEWAEQGTNSSSVLLTAHRLLALQEIIARELAPAMRASFAVTQLQGNELTLIADHAAMAAKLRQLQTSLLKHIQAAGWNVEILKFKVATRPSAPQIHQTPKLARALDHSDLRHFETLSTHLEPGPLADAVTKLLSRHRKND